METSTTTAAHARPLVDRTCLFATPTRPLQRAVAGELAALGATVVIGHHRAQAPVRTVDVTERPTEASPTARVIGDFSATSTVGTVRDEVTKAAGSIDLLVVTAGFDQTDTAGGSEPRSATQPAPARENPPVDACTWRSTRDTLGRVFATVDGFYDDLQTASDGRLIALTTLGQPWEDPAVSTAESALVGLVRSLAKELAATSATANCVVTPTGVEENDRAAVASETAAVIGALAGVTREPQAADPSINGSVIDLTTCLDPS